MTDNYKTLNEYKILSLLDKFYVLFLSIYKNNSFSNKEAYMKCGTSLFKKWYCSALVNNSSITPAEMVDFFTPAYNRYKIDEQEFYFKHTVKYSRVQYSVEHHPIVYDFKNIINIGKNSIQFDNTGNLININKMALKQMLSNTDDFYIYYLLEVGMELGVISTMPSIGVTTYVTEKAAKDFFKKDDTELLNVLVNCSCKLAKKKVLPDNMSFIDDKVERWLKECNSLDDIIKPILKNKDKYDAIDLTRIILDMGMLFDKYFLTPFGYYYRFVIPFYSMPFDMINEFMFIDSLVEDFEELNYEDYSDITFSPCTSYQLSRLGKKYFNCDCGKKSLLEKLNLEAEEVFDIILNKKVEKYHKLRSDVDEQSDLIKLKISDNENVNDSVIEKFSESLSLAVLCTSILDIFHLYYDSYDYSFYALPKTIFSEFRYDSENFNYNTINVTLKDIFCRFDKLYLQFRENKIFIIEKL